MISKVDFEPCRAVMALNFLLISNLEDGKYKSHGYTALTPEIPSSDFWKSPIMSFIQVTPVVTIMCRRLSLYLQVNARA